MSVGKVKYDYYNNRLILNSVLWNQKCKIIFFTHSGKTDDDEEGTISRPGSPKEGQAEEGKDDAATDAVAPIVREKSGASVRIGQYIILYFIVCGSEICETMCRLYRSSFNSETP